MTGYGSDDDRRRGRDAGFDAHLVKPINLPEILRQLNPEPAAVPGMNALKPRKSFR